MYCTHCGKKIPPESRRCPKCGADLTYETNVIRNRPDDGPRRRSSRGKRTAGLIFGLVIALAALECIWVFVLSPKNLEKKTTDSFAAAAANASKQDPGDEAVVTKKPESAKPEASGQSSGAVTAPTATPVVTPRVETPKPTPVVTPTPEPTKVPTQKPTPVPTAAPTPEPTRIPEPTAEPEPVQVWREEETTIQTYEQADEIYGETTKTNYYILPESDSAIISDHDLEDLSDADLRIARNEIYARHGLIFKSEDLNIYFSNQAWYHGTSSDADSIALSGIEQENLQTILNYEEEKGNTQGSVLNTGTFEQIQNGTISEGYDYEELTGGIVGEELILDEPVPEDVPGEEDFELAEEDFEAGEENFEIFGEDYDYVEEDTEDAQAGDGPEIDEDAGAGSARDYILPDSAVKKVTSKQLAKLSEKDIRIARNEIYARHGLIFQSEDLNEYFGAKQWYEGTTEDSDSIVLSDVEQKNLEAIIAYEKKHNLNQ